MTDTGGKSAPQASEPPTTGDAAPRRRGGFFRTRTFGRWTARLLSLLGIALIILGLTGWWLTTRVLDDDGFGDVVAKTVQQQAVRDYIGDQATLQLARSNKLITAARPVVAKAIAEALNSPAVIAAVHSFAAGAHHQIFQISNTSLSDAAASNAAATIKGALQAVDPKLADKLPDNVLNATTNISQNRLVDAAARASTWVPWLYIPFGILGVAVLLLVLAKAEEPVRATRFIGFTMALAGALPIGLGIATPLFAYLGCECRSWPRASRRRVHQGAARPSGRRRLGDVDTRAAPGLRAGHATARHRDPRRPGCARGSAGRALGRRGSSPVPSWPSPWRRYLITRPNDLFYWVGLILAASPATWRSS